MSNTISFEKMLTGGHPNSLGQTEEVVALIIADRKQLEELYQCYFSEDEVVRLRTSSAFKRICKAHPEWVLPYTDKFLTEISKINQASTQWTLAILFDELVQLMSDVQIAAARKVMQHNLEHHNDWIVLNTTMQVLANWSKDDDELRTWLFPILEKLMKDDRKSVSNRAGKLHKLLGNQTK